MTIEQFETELTAKAPAVHYLNDAVAEFLLNRGHAAKIGEIATQIGKRIGASPKLIREALASNPRFIGEERRWNLSLRSEFHRPVEGALQHTLRMFGKPMTVMACSNEMAVLNARSPEYFQGFLPRLMTDRPQTYFQTPDDHWGLREWLLDLTGRDEQDMLLRNFFTDLAALEPQLEQARGVALDPEMSYADAAITLLRAFGHPVNNKILSYAVWRSKGDRFDPLASYLELLDDPRIHLLSGSDWMLAEQLPEITPSLQKLSVLADTVLAEEEVWEGPYVVSEEDLNEIFDFTIEHGRPQKVSDLIEAVFEYGKSSPRYAAIQEALMPALQTDPRFQLVGQQTWTLPTLISQEVLQVPETLLPETIDPSTFADPETDAELEDDGLEGKLAIWVHDPRYEDFGGEHEVELSPELMSEESVLDETRIPLLYDHHEMGTLKLRQSDMSFFPTDTPLACVTIHGERFDTFQIWINNEELLIHGLADWYRVREVPIGAVLTFRRLEEPDDFSVSWDGEIDDLIALPEERINDLIDLRDGAEQEQWSVYEIMCRLLRGHPEGAHFLTLWAEVNVVRRTPKRVVASNLSSYHCFVQVSNTERWRLDERKLDQGRKKTKKKYIIQ